MFFNKTKGELGVCVYVSVRVCVCVSVVSENAQMFAECICHLVWFVCACQLCVRGRLCVCVSDLDVFYSEVTMSREAADFHLSCSFLASLQPQRHTRRFSVYSLSD